MIIWFLFGVLYEGSKFIFDKDYKAEFNAQLTGLQNIIKISKFLAIIITLIISGLVGFAGPFIDALIYFKNRGNKKRG